MCPYMCVSPCVYVCPCVCVYVHTLTGVVALAVTDICREHYGMSVQPADSRRHENSSPSLNSKNYIKSG